MPLPRHVLLALVLLTAPLVGCLSGNDPSSTDDGAPAYHISRALRLDLDEERVRAMDGAADPFALLESYLDASLAVRVGAAGSYTLSYTTAEGDATTIPLDNMAPGSPRTIPSVHPFAAATLKRGDETLATRAPIDLATFRAGDIPLGVSVAPGAEIAYTHALDISSHLQATDIAVDDGWIARTADVRLDVPLRGAITMSAPLLASLLEGTRIDLNGTLRVETGAPLATLDLAVERAGEPGRLGFEAAPSDARVAGALSLWFKNDRLDAVQAQGGHVAFEPGIRAWAEGSAADAWGSECRGATRTQPCTPNGPPTVSESAPPGSREMLGDDLRATRPAEQRAVEFLERVLAHDLAVGDAFTLDVELDSQDAAHGERSTYSWRLTLETKVASNERITVEAGAFDALRIAQSARVRADVESIVEAQYDWRNQTTTWEEMMRDLHVDETVARHTIWLDAATFQPLRVESESPVQPGALAARVVDSITDAGWVDLPTERVPADAFAWTLTATSRLEATRISPGAQFSPYAGLALGSILGGGAGVWNAPAVLLGGLPFRGLGMSHDEAVHAVPERPPYPDGNTTAPRPVATPTPATSHPHWHLSLALEAPVEDGFATLLVESADAFAWGDLAIVIEGTPWQQAVADADCAAPPPSGGFVVCHQGAPRGPQDAVAAGDSIRLGGVAAGQNLYVEHVPSHEIVAKLTLA